MLVSVVHERDIPVRNAAGVMLERKIRRRISGVFACKRELVVFPSQIPDDVPCQVVDLQHGRGLAA